MKIAKNDPKVKKSYYAIRAGKTVQCECEECGHTFLLLKDEVIVCENCGNSR